MKDLLLGQLLPEREKWQNDTLQEVRKRLVLYSGVGSGYGTGRSESSLKLNRAEGEKLAVIYGPPQIGKTMLILVLMGIAEEYQQRIYKLLRAGMPKGNASTATAILYQRTASDHFGVRYDGGGGAEEADELKESELASRLRELRERVEEGEACGDILHLYIPGLFFDKAAEEYSNISILDLPGAESNNSRERDHVDRVIKRYMGLATVNIIACRANEINSLQELELPDGVAWKEMPYKYFVVITHAFSQDSIRTYFNEEREHRKKKRRPDFSDFVRERYSEEMESILSQGIECFPVDVGDSLEKLKKEYVKDRDDREEITKTLAGFAEEIRNAIQQKNGDGLKHVMEILRHDIGRYAEEKRRQIEVEIAEKEKELEKLREEQKKAENWLELGNDMMNRLKEKAEEYSRLIRMKAEISDRAEEKLQSYQKEFWSCVLSRAKNGKIKDSGKNLLAEMREKMKECSKSFLESIGRESYEDACREIYMDLSLKPDIEAPVEKLYQEKFLLLFGFKMDEYQKAASESFQVLGEHLKEKAQGMIDAKCRSLKKDADNYKKSEWLRIIAEKKVERTEREQEKCREALDGLKQRRVRIENDVKEDQNLIRQYKEIAKEKFDAYWGEKKHVLDSNSLSRYDKASLLVYLGLLEKDYNRIMV